MTGDGTTNQEYHMLQIAHPTKSGSYLRIPLVYGSPTTGKSIALHVLRSVLPDVYILDTDDLDDAECEAADYDLRLIVARRIAAGAVAPALIFTNFGRVFTACDRDMEPDMVYLRLNVRATKALALSRGNTITFANALARVSEQLRRYVESNHTMRSRIARWISRNYAWLILDNDEYIHPADVLNYLALHLPDTPVSRALALGDRLTEGAVERLGDWFSEPLLPWQIPRLGHFTPDRRIDACDDSPLVMWRAPSGAQRARTLLVSASPAYGPYVTLARARRLQPAADDRTVTGKTTGSDAWIATGSDWPKPGETVAHHERFKDKPRGFIL